MLIAPFLLEVASAVVLVEATFYAREPSTLTLAFIAFAVVVGYVSTARLRRPAECERVVPAERRDGDAPRRDAA